MMITGCLTLLAPIGAQAADMTVRLGYRLFTFPATTVNTWHGDDERWTFDGIPIRPPAALRVDGDDLPALPRGFVKTTVPAWDRAAIEQSLRKDVAPGIERDAGTVALRTESGSVMFDGVGLTGRKIDMDAAVQLIIVALERGVSDVELPVIETQPTMTVDKALQELGVHEVVSIGESDFRGSPTNRRHNIGVGLKKFNGHIIPQGTVFSFNAVLGPVNEYTGYRKELTIKGDKTLPDYGGGLCQISTTAYRGAWEYGLPIVDRRNHSYTVRYYAPVGTDATIYPPAADIRFRNDTQGDIVIQTYQADDQAYFIYYGTRDDRHTTLAGPYIWDRTQPPPAKTEFTTEIAPGEKRKVGESVPGMKTMWFRTVTAGTGSTTETFYSYYEARPLFTQIGVEPVAETPVLPEQSEAAPAPQSSSSPVSGRPRSVEKPPRRR